MSPCRSRYCFIFELIQSLIDISALNRSKILIHCPEADDIIILSLELQLIEYMLKRFSIHLFSSVHKKIVDAETKQPTKNQKNQLQFKILRKQLPK